MGFRPPLNILFNMKSCRAIWRFITKKRIIWFYNTLLTNVAKYVGNWPVNTDSLSGIYTGLNTEKQVQYGFEQVFIQEWACALSNKQNKMEDDITDTVYISNWCMVTENIMKWVFWYLSYIMSSYKHWNLECVGDNHPSIVLNKIGSIFTLVYGYWKYHEMGVFIFILHYFLVQTLKCGMFLRQPPLRTAFIGCILHISVLVNIGCFYIGCILHTGVLVIKGIMK